MKRYFLAYFFIIISSLSYSQTINGRLVEFESDANPFDSTLIITLQLKLNENESAILGHAFNLKFDFDSLSFEFIQGTYINFNEADGYRTTPITNPGNSRTIQNIETQLISGPGLEINDSYMDFVMFEFRIIDFSQSQVICPMNNINGFHFYSPGSLQNWNNGEWLCYEPNIPVELISFTAKLSSKDVILSWQTATELNNHGFKIERKLYDSEWEGIGFVEGNGTTTEHRKYSFSDRSLTAGKYFYRLKQIDNNGTYEYSNIVEVTLSNITSFSLEQNYPNPFNPSTNIRYTIPENTFVTLKVYNILGSEISTLVMENENAGEHEVKFDASSLSNGIYFYELKAGNHLETKKMILMK